MVLRRQSSQGFSKCQAETGGAGRNPQNTEQPASLSAVTDNKGSPLTNGANWNNNIRAFEKKMCRCSSCLDRELAILDTVTWAQRTCTTSLSSVILECCPWLSLALTSRSVGNLLSNHIDPDLPRDVNRGQQERRICHEERQVLHSERKRSSRLLSSHKSILCKKRGMKCSKVPSKLFLISLKTSFAMSFLTCRLTIF